MASKRKRSSAAPGRATAPSAPERERAGRTAQQPPAFPIVGIGGSAGGIEAFKLLLGALPPDTGMAFVFVLHLAPGHESVLAQILARETRMPVHEVNDEPEVLPNHVYVIPPGKAMTVANGRLHLMREANTPPHPVDTFLNSLALDQGHRAVGVILSGTLNDGTLGLAAIKSAAGITFAQDDSAQHDGMPRSAINAGCVDFVLSPSEIAAELVRLARHPYVAEADADAVPSEADFDAVLAQLKRHSGVNFRQYRSNTLRRRLRRRMALQKCTTLREYAELLQQRPAEAEALYQDILISVTDFFRNPEAFQALRTQVLPRLYGNRSRNDAVRAWVLGCSTGEEAYSLAILLAEYAAGNRIAVPAVLYATDLNGAALERSRAGLYPKSIAEHVSPERLRRFFVEADGGYRVAKSIRDMCIFARHNVLTDPPFSRMDLIACRNVMIYMQSTLQRELLLKLHYALKPDGFLFLGSSETVGAYPELFEPQDKRQGIYSKKLVALRPENDFPLLVSSTPSVQARRGADPPRDRELDLQREADRALLARYVPAGVLVNEALDIVQFRGNTGLYLSPAPGKASLSVLKMAREGLLVGLRRLLQRARQEDGSVSETGLTVRSNGGHRRVSLTVVPVRRAVAEERWYWVLFEDAERQHAAESAKSAPRRRTAGGGARGAPDKAPREKDQVARLSHELEATREYLQSVVEQQEAANEELQSANQEVQSANEELQSINEELETSKEEIQSSNEELRTVNEELHERNEELSRLNDDLNNLFLSVQLAIVMVWQDLRIRRFTPLAAQHFNLIASDIGRPIGDITLRFDLPNLTELLREVIGSGSIRELEVRDSKGRWYLLRIRPYRTGKDRIDGAVVVLVDIDTIKANQETLARQATLLEQAHDAILAHELDGTIRFWNEGARQLYGHTPEEAIGRRVSELLWTGDAPCQEIDHALAVHGRWRGELRQRTKEGRELIGETVMVVLEQAGGKLVLSTNHDVTEHKQMERELQAQVRELAVADRNKSEFLAVLAHELRNPLAPLRNAAHILTRAGAVDEQSVRARELIERQVDTITRMVDDLLDASRVNRGQVRLEIQPIELQAVIRRALEAVRPLLDQRRHRLSLQLPAAPILLDADPVRLEQVFWNLLTNAAKYTPEDGEISVSAELRPASPAGSGTPGVVVHVRDSGVGIEPAMLPRVFDLFAQADRSRARAQGGLGIGLSVVRSLVELHGGQVSAHSDGPGHGSEFRVQLPLSAQAAADQKADGGDGGAPGGDGEARGGAAGVRSGAAGARGGVAGARGAAPEASASTPEGTRVLVVDDNPDIAESTSLILSMAGFSVRSALSGEEALQIASQFEPGVVLLDIGMPGLDGYAVAQRLRREPRLKDAVLIAVSGYGSAADRSRAREAGFDVHLVKPVEPLALQRTLSEVTLRRRAPGRESRPRDRR